VDAGLAEDAPTDTVTVRELHEDERELQARVREARVVYFQ
jgi:hypothetical protein